ncbi:hypothetical protein BEH94_12075 [Candidatus Altiarchaeales archaeon WOR_SM1_SCG]|nr:hypothetical protein BEH94_12075 [Candidatus Altiarchaeales archaeon WOR_SM1_SCG]
MLNKLFDYKMVGFDPEETAKVKEICELYDKTKNWMLYAEEIDHEFKAFIQPVNELRHAFDHLMRLAAVKLEIRPEPGEGYVKNQLEKVLGHVFRGAFDTLDKLSITLREKITNELSPFSVYAIQAALPDYYSKIKPDIEEITEKIAEKRANKDVSLICYAEIEEYSNLIERLKKYHKSIIKIKPSLIECEEKIKADEKRREQENSKPEMFSDKKVFIIHGHDEGTREKVARFLMNINLEPIILDEQPDEGQTIIEKLEKHSVGAGFAIALLTPDDVGAPKSNIDNLRDRARQNVILELAYFMGNLGRKRMCILNKGVEIPSDYSGILYIPLDKNNAWKTKLARKLKNAGLKINKDGLI